LRNSSGVEQVELSTHLFEGPRVLSLVHYAWKKRRAIDICCACRSDSLCHVTVPATLLLYTYTTTTGKPRVRLAPHRRALLGKAFIPEHGRARFYRCGSVSTASSVPQCYDSLRPYICRGHSQHLECYQTTILFRSIWGAHGVDLGSTLGISRASASNGSASWGCARFFGDIAIAYPALWSHIDLARNMQ
jgi:hypothetical protein